MNIFGWEVSKQLKKGGVQSVNEPIVPSLSASTPPPQSKSFVPKEEVDGSTVISAGGYFGQYVDIDGTTVASDQDLILKYRNAGEQPECDKAVGYIVDEAIVSNDDSAPVSLSLNDLDYDESVKEEIMEEFSKIVELLDFNSRSTDIFRQWYVDGRTYYHIIIDEKNPSAGISELRYIDPLKMRKVREVDTTIDSATGVKVITTKAEYFIYNENQIAGQLVTTVNTGDAITGLKIDPACVCYVPSGVLDSTHKRVVSHIHKALKPVNQLRMMEDSLVIYRISRAPERRIFYIDVGNLPKGKAEEYMQGIMSKYRNKMVYDASTGDLRDDRRHMSMLEDFWLPRREGGKGTEITTLPGGENLGQIDDILFFKKNLYHSLNVPMSRFEQTAGFSLGKSEEVSREEVSFQKFINRLRKKFSYIFLRLLKTQLILKGIITEEDWIEIKEKIRVDFQRDNYFTELKEFEILRERLTMLTSVEPHIGKYYSTKWVRRKILRQTDEDIKMMDDEIAEEVATGQIQPEQGVSSEKEGTEIEKPGEEEITSEDEESTETTLPEENPIEGDEEELHPEITEIEEDGKMVPTLGSKGIAKVVAEWQLDSKPYAGEKIKYVKVTNPRNGESQLFDPSITTEKQLLSVLKLK